MRETVDEAKIFLESTGHIGLPSETRSQRKQLENTVDVLFSPDEKDITRLSEDDFNKYRQQLGMMFRLFNEKKDGKLVETEMESIFRAMGKDKTKPKVTQIFKAVDTEKVGFIKCDQFIEYIINKRKLKAEKFVLETSKPDEKLEKEEKGKTEVETKKKKEKKAATKLARTSTMDETSDEGANFLSQTGYSAKPNETRTQQKIRETVDIMLAPDKRDITQLSKEELDKYKQELYMMFRLFNEKKDGHLIEKEMEQIFRAMGKNKAKSKVTQIFKTIDTKSTGYITKDQFVEYILNKRKLKAEKAKEIHSTKKTPAKKTEKKEQATEKKEDKTPAKKNSRQKD